MYKFLFVNFSTEVTLTAENLVLAYCNLVTQHVQKWEMAFISFKIPNIVQDFISQ